MSIDIVTHCYAGHLPQYARLLALQLSSVVVNMPAVSSVRVRVCATPGDAATMEVLEGGVKGRHDERLPDGFTLDKILLTPERLGRRAIGRNIAARETTADVVWFTDVDHWFGPECLDQAYRYWWADPNGRAEHMWYPEQLSISKTHELGDLQWQGQADAWALENFEPKTYNRPIGGVFIVSGKHARQNGYLPDSKWQQPVARMFGDFKDDVVYRKQFKTTVKVAIPNLFRIRHTQSTYPGGKNAGKHGGADSGGDGGQGGLR